MQSGSDQVTQQPRVPVPRKLEQKETLQSLNQWRNTFRNYYRRCQFYGLFLSPDTSWDNSLSRGFIENESTGLKRSPKILAADLEGFLSCLASYLPFDYVEQKLNNESTDINKVWEIVYEIYDAELNTVNFLDFTSMSREENETYRNFYNRLVGFVGQHLPKRETEVSSVLIPVKT